MLKLGQEPFHFRLGVAIAGFCSGGNSLSEDRASVFGARLLGQQLAQHLVARNIGGIALQQLAELRLGVGGVAAIHEFEGKPVARKRVIRFFCYERFEHFTARFFGCGHGVQVV